MVTAIAPLSLSPSLIQNILILFSVSILPNPGKPAANKYPKNTKTTKDESNLHRFKKKKKLFKEHLRFNYMSNSNHKETSQVL